MAKEKMTLEQLAERIDKRFDESKQFTSKKFDESKQFTKDFTNSKIEELARMVANGFLEVYHRIDQVEKNLNDKIETETESLRAEMQTEFRYIRNEINDIKAKLDKLSKRTLEDNSAISDELFNLRKRVTILEKQLKELKSANI